jgi:hypothetical protein
MGAIQARSASFHATGILLPVGLELDSLSLTLGPFAVGLDPLDLNHGSPGTFEAVLRLAALAAFIEAKAKGAVRDVRVSPKGGDLEIQATAKMVLEVRIVLRCGLRIESGTRVFVDLLDVSLPMARGLIQAELDKLNPVLDASALPLDVTLQEIVVSEEAAVLKGQAAWPSQSP